LQEFEHGTFEEAERKPKWEASMKVECDALMRNKTWVLSTLPLGKKFIGYNTKLILSPKDMHMRKG
jgi:hypothetical protein